MHILILQDHERGKLGDATKETLKTYGDNTGGWYDDNAYLVYDSRPWFLRSGNANADTTGGIFYFYYSSGIEYFPYTSRSVLVNTN